MCSALLITVHTKVLEIKVIPVPGVHLESVNGNTYIENPTAKGLNLLARCSIPSLLKAASVAGSLEKFDKFGARSSLLLDRVIRREKDDGGGKMRSDADIDIPLLAS